MWAASTKTQVVGILGYAGHTSAASAPAPASAFIAIRKGISDTLRPSLPKFLCPRSCFLLLPVSPCAVGQFIAGDTESHYQLTPNWLSILVTFSSPQYSHLKLLPVAARDGEAVSTVEPWQCWTSMISIVVVGPRWPLPWVLSSRHLHHFLGRAYTLLTEVSTSPFKWERVHNCVLAITCSLKFNKKPRHFTCYIISALAQCTT